MRAATAVAFGAAEEVPKKLGKFCERFVLVAGSPGNGGLLVSMMLPGKKNEVLPPSGAVTDGFCTSTGPVEIGEPSGLSTYRPGPKELNGSLASGFWPRYGAGAHHGVAPMPIVFRAVSWPAAAG